MTIKWIGAVMILISCGGCGFSIAAVSRKEERTLQQLVYALRYMQSELEYRLTPLPDLCLNAAYETSGSLRKVFLQLSGELDQQSSPDVLSCMKTAMRGFEDFSAHVRRHLLNMGRSLGKFDLNGQLYGLQAVQAECEADLSALNKNREARLRSYRTLGLCAGAAIVIIFI